MSGQSTKTAPVSSDPSAVSPHQYSDVQVALMRHSAKPGWTMRGIASESQAMFKNSLQRRLDAGDITPADVQALKKASKWPGILSFAGALVMIPVWRQLGRPTIGAPKGAPMGFKLLTVGLMGLMGSTIGMMTGGLVSMASVKKNMPDSARKMGVFQEVEYDAMRAVQERMAGVPDGTIVVHLAGIPGQTRYMTPLEARAALDDLAAKGGNDV